MQTKHFRTAVNLSFQLLVISVLIPFEKFLIFIRFSERFEPQFNFIRSIKEAMLPLAMEHAYEEKDILRTIQQSVRKGGVFVDVGANFGFYGLRLSRQGLSVISFEPDPKVSFVLMVLSIGTRSKIYRTAISDDYSDYSIHSPERRIGYQSSSSPFVYSSEKSSLPLDYFTGEFNEIELLKIDVEGHECEVIRGAGSTLRKARRLLIEYHWGYENPITLVEQIGFRSRFLRKAMDNKRPYGELWLCSKSGSNGEG